MVIAVESLPINTEDLTGLLIDYLYAARYKDSNNNNLQRHQ